MRTFFSEYLGVDRRSLALMRVLASIIIIADLCIRFHWMHAFYGVGSVYPPEIILHAVRTSPVPFLFSIVAYAPSIPTLLFVGALIGSFFLLIGWRTRIATITVWLFILLLQFLDPLILQGGDNVMRLMLFIAMFLPWGDRYSVDSALRFEQKSPVWFVSPWTFVLIFQISLIYLFAGLEKTAGFDWLSGSGVYYALSIEQFATPFSHILYHYPLIMMAISYGVRALQLLTLFLIFSPWCTVVTRTFAITALMLMHFSFALHLRIGIFSWICIAVLTSLLPMRFWEYSGRLITSLCGGITIYYDGDCGFCKKSVYLIRVFLLMPSAQLIQAQQDPIILNVMRTHDSWVVEDKNGAHTVGFNAFITICRHSPLVFWTTPFLRLSIVRSIGESAYRLVASTRSRVCVDSMPVVLRSRYVEKILPIANVISAVIFSVVILWYLVAATPYTHVTFPKGLQHVMEVIGINQNWALFAPSPAKGSGWYMFDGTQENGTHVDVFHPDLPLTTAKPSDISASFPNDRWRKYLLNISSTSSAAKNGPYLGAYFCNSWNVSHEGDEKLSSLRVTFFDELTELQYLRKTVVPITLTDIDCKSLSSK